MFARILLSVLVVFLMTGTSFALHPLITDDTGVQGRGKTEMEMGFERSRESEDGTTQTTSSITATLTHGLNDSMDLILGIPYQHIRTKATELTSNEEGMSDTTIELKWRFYEKERLSLALKPSITLPTGNKKEGLGNGRTTYGVYFIATKEMKPLTVHLNVQYKRNENRLDNQVDLWHASAASELEILKGLRFVASIDMDRNTSKASNVDPAFLLGGLVYSISEDLDIDIGYKHGLNKPAIDYSVLTGIIYRF